MPEKRGTTGVVAYIACLMFVGASLSGGMRQDQGAPLASALAFRGGTFERNVPAVSGSDFRIEINGRSYVARIVGEIPTESPTAFDLSAVRY